MAQAEMHSTIKSCGEAGRPGNLATKGYPEVRDCRDGAAGQSSGVPNESRRQIMSMMSSAAALAVSSRAVAGSGAAAVLAASGVTAQPTDDRELLELASRYEACKAAIAAAQQRLNSLPDYLPPCPAAMCRRKADARLFRYTHCDLREPSAAVGEPYNDHEIDLLRKYRIMRNRDIGEVNDPGFRVVREPWPFAQARADAILAADAEWDRQIAEAWERSGEGRIQRQLGAAQDEMEAIVAAVGAAEPRSGAGVRLKARLALDISAGHPRERASELAWSVVRAVAA